MSINFLERFQRFAGKGRAWKVKDLFTKNSILSFLSISEKARLMLKTIPEQAYPWSCDDNVVPYWERHFGISPVNTATIEERRRGIIAEYIAIGSNAAAYLQYILSSNDFNVEVVENLDGLDVGGSFDAAPYRIGSGEVYVYGTPATQENISYIDPIQKPTTERQFRNIFAVRDIINPDSIALLKRLIIKYKPAHTVAIVINNDPESTFWDAELVSEFIAPVHVIDAELITDPDNSEFVFDAELMV